MTTTKKLSQNLKSFVAEQNLKFELISMQTWSYKPSPEKWSKKEIIGHLIDSAFNNIQRFIRIQYNDKTNLHYDQDEWVKVGNYQNQDINSIIDLWSSVNMQIAQIWLNTSDDQLVKTIPVMGQNPTLKFLMEDYLTHMEHHLKQIRNERP